MAFRWSEGKSQKKGHFRRKIDVATVGALTVPKIEVCAIPQIKNENLYSLLSNKKKFGRKDPETGKRQQFEIGAKSSKIDKNRPLHLRRAPKWENMEYWRFFLILPRLQRAVIFLFLGLFYQFFFCLKAENRNFHFLFVEQRISQCLAQLRALWRTWHNSLEFSTNHEQETASEGDVS